MAESIVQYRQCTSCSITQPLDEFRLKKLRYRVSQCRSCEKVNALARYYRNHQRKPPSERRPRQSVLPPLVGQVFGRLIVREYLRTRPKGGHLWLCDCACGNTSEVLTASLKRGDIVSCGCYRAEMMSKRQHVHGMTKTPTHTTWQMMKQRCLNKKAKDYSRYGGRGINICERWRTSFTNFLADMGVRPSLDHTLERKNNAGPYSPENCKWATIDEQANNRRGNRFLEYKGRRQTLFQWAHELRIGVTTLGERLKRWSVEKSLETPVRQRRKLTKDS